MATKSYPYPISIDTTGFKLRWNDIEVSETEYKQLEQEAIEYNETLNALKIDDEYPTKKRSKSKRS